MKNVNEAKLLMNEFETAHAKFISAHETFNALLTVNTEISESEDYLLNSQREFAEFRDVSYQWIAKLTEGNEQFSKVERAQRQKLSLEEDIERLKEERTLLLQSFELEQIKRTEELELEKLFIQLNTQADMQRERDKRYLERMKS